MNCAGGMNDLRFNHAAMTQWLYGFCGNFCLSKFGQEPAWTSSINENSVTGWGGGVSEHVRVAYPFELMNDCILGG